MKTDTRNLLLSYSPYLLVEGSLLLQLTHSHFVDCRTKLKLLMKSVYKFNSTREVWLCAEVLYITRILKLKMTSIQTICHTAYPVCINYVGQVSRQERAKYSQLYVEIQLQRYNELSTYIYIVAFPTVCFTLVCILTLHTYVQCLAILLNCELKYICVWLFASFYDPFDVLRPQRMLVTQRWASGSS